MADRPRLAEKPQEREVAMNAIRITLPLPDPLLLPRRTISMHWAQKGRHVGAQREMAGFMAAEVMRSLGAVSGEPLWPSERVRMDIEVRPRPRMKQADDDNFWIAMKHYRDGLADAGIVANDKQFVIGALTWSEQRTSELVLTLTPLAP
jgi:hypothetical protein